VGKGFGEGFDTSIESGGGDSECERGILTDRCASRVGKGVIFTLREGFERGERGRWGRGVGNIYTIRA
jgi:hypothetical protein